MRKSLFFALTLLSTLTFSQAPQFLNYQAIARDASGNIVTNPIGIKFEILQGSPSPTVTYEETNTITPGSAGVFTAAIGGGTPVVGTFSLIPWANKPYFIRVSIDPTGGTSYSTVGTSELLSVPYALFAEKAGNTQTVNITGTNVIGAYPNYTITSPGVLTPSTGISIAGGTITNTAPDQTVAISGAVGTYPNFTITPTPPITITPGDLNIFVNGTSPNFTIGSAPSLSVSGAQLSISNGNTVTLPTGTTYTNGTGISLTSGTIITNTAPDQTVTIGNGTNVNVTGTYPSFVVNATPTLAYVSNTLSISGGNSVVINMPNPLIAGSGISITSGTISNTALNQTVTLSNGTNVNVNGTYPNFTVNSIPTLSIASNTLSISGGNSVTLPSSPTYSAGVGISLASGSITNTAPNQTVNVSGPGVIGTYPNYTVTATPQTSVSSGSSNVIITGSVPSYSVIVLNPVISGAGSTTVTNAGNSYTVNTPPVNLSFVPSSGILSYTPSSGSNTINILPSVSFTNNVLTVGTNTTLIPGTGLWTRQSTTATTLSNINDLVGIGTNVPSAQLDVSSTSFNVLNLRTSAAGSNVNVDAFPTGAGNLQFRTVTANGISFATSNINRMLINPSGNVGIGTMLPSYPLHVQKGNASAFVTSIENTDALGWGLEVRVANTSNSINAFDVYSNGIERFLVRADGYVGIGAPVPTTILNLLGVNSTTFINAFSASPESAIRIANDDLTNNNFSSVIFSTKATNFASFEAAKIVGVNTNHTTGSIGGDLVFMTRDPSNLFERMRITSNGNIGIRTQFPAAELEVNGYTKLGSNGPAIQTYKTTGTTAPTQGNTASIVLPAFIPPGKIISIDVMVNWSGAVGDWIQPGYTVSAGFEFNWSTSGNTVFVTNKNLNSGSILSKLFVVTVVYEQ